MDLALSEEQTIIIDQVRRFVRDEIVPREDALDPDADELPPEDFEHLSNKVKAMGLFGLDKLGNVDRTVDRLSETLARMN